MHGIPGFKLGKFRHLGEPMDLSGGRETTADREPNAADEALLRRFTERYFPRAAGPTMALKVCFFTNTPDEHFIIDAHPQQSNVIIAAGFSGHGYQLPRGGGGAGGAGVGWGGEIGGDGVWVGEIWVKGYRSYL